MDFGLPTTTTQSVYQPYTTTNYKTTQSVQNVDLGNILTTTEDYPVTSYANVEAPTYTTGETFTTTNYETTTPTYTTTNEYTTTDYGATTTTSTVADYPVTNYTTTTPAVTTQDYTTTAYETAAVETTPATTVDYSAYESIPAATTSYQEVAAPATQVVTRYKQVVTTRMEPRLVTKYVQVPVTKMVPIEQARAMSLFPKPKPQCLSQILL